MFVSARALSRSGALIVVAAVVALNAHAARSDSGSKQLQRVSGTVGYQVGENGTFSPVTGTLVLSDDAYAITRGRSKGLITLPDSTRVGIGAETKIRVSAFNQIAQVGPHTIAVLNGALRFEVQHPAGGRANYRFTTPSTQISVRGTVGLIAADPDRDIVGCVSCAADDVVVTVGSQTFTLLSGQAIVVEHPAGATPTGHQEFFDKSLGTRFTDALLNTNPSELTETFLPEGSREGLPWWVGPALLGAGAAASGGGSTNTGRTVTIPTAAPTPKGTPTPAPGQ